MTKKKNKTESTPTPRYVIAQGDVEQIQQTILQIDAYTLQRGRLLDEFVKRDRKLEKMKDSIVESQNMIINMLRQKTGAPEGHVLNLSTLEFVPSMAQQKE